MADPPSPGRYAPFPALSSRQRLPGQTRQAASTSVGAGRTRHCTQTSRQARCAGAGLGDLLDWMKRAETARRLQPACLGAERGSNRENDAFPTGTGHQQPAREPRSAPCEIRGGSPPASPHPLRRRLADDPPRSIVNPDLKAAFRQIPLRAASLSTSQTSRASPTARSRKRWAPLWAP